MLGNERKHLYILFEKLKTQYVSGNDNWNIRNPLINCNNA